MSKHSDDIIQNMSGMKSNVILKDHIQNNNTNENINVDIDSEIVRNSELDPEARSYKPIKTDERLKENTQDFLESAVQFELDYHFGDVSLSMDNYLLSRMHENKDHWVSFDIVANLTKVKGYTTDENIIRRAIRKSKLLIFNEDETKVKRPNFEPPKPKQHKDLRRTVFLYGLKINICEKEIRYLCGKYGNVRKVVLDDPEETKIKLFENEECVKHKPNELGEDKRHSVLLDTVPPDREVAEIVMKKKFGSRYVPLNNNNNNNNNNNTNENNTPLVPSLHVDTSGNPISSIPITPNVGVTQPFIHPTPNPNGDPNDFTHLRSCFVVFESQGQATKCVKDRLRSEDGIRAMHQYDFNKAKKKVAAAKARGFSPMFSPLVTTIPTNVSSQPNQQFSFSSFINPLALGPSYMNNNYSSGSNNYRHSSNGYYTRRSYDNKHPQSARHYNNNKGNNIRRNTYSHSKKVPQSTRNYRHSTNSYRNNNRNNNHSRNNNNRRTGDNSRWGFTNERGNNRNRSSPRITPKKPFISRSYSNFEGITAKAPENHAGFGWKRNSHKYKHTQPPKPSPNNFTFGTNESNKNKKHSHYYTYHKKSPNTPNDLTATITESSRKTRPRTTTSITKH